MGVIYRHRCTRPLPKGATIQQIDGQRFAFWPGARGRLNSAVVITRDGEDRIIHRRNRYMVRYFDENGERQEVHCGHGRKRDAARLLAKMENDVKRKKEAKRQAELDAAAQLADDGAVKISELLATYLGIRSVSKDNITLFHRTITLLEEFLGHRATVTDLVDDRISGFIAHLEGTFKPNTIAGHRTRILGLWRLAYRRRLVERGPEEVRKAPIPEPHPKAWSMDEMRRLVAACDRMEEGRVYFKALILAAYETGLRRGDLMRLHRDDIGADGVVSIRQHKTGRVITRKIRPETAAIMLSLPGACPLEIFWGSKKYTRLWQELRKLAGVDSEGGLHQLRRTGASHVARTRGTDAARQFLGHRSPEMIAHYLDPRITQREIIVPPALDSAD